MHRSLKALSLTKDRKEISLWLILKILRMGFYFLHLVLLIYISMIYSFICLNLINIRLLIRPSIVRLHFKISMKILILLLISAMLVSVIFACLLKVALVIGAYKAILLAFLTG